MSEARDHEIPTQNRGRVNDQPIPKKMFDRFRNDARIVAGRADFWDCIF